MLLTRCERQIGCVRRLRYRVEFLLPPVMLSPAKDLVASEMQVKVEVISAREIHGERLVRCLAAKRQSE